jgi:hippurate hydrolase
VPHEAIDLVLVGSQIVVALNSIVSRNVDPVKHAVLTVATFQTESDTQNVIAQTVKLRGTVRCFDGDVRDVIEERFTALCSTIAAAHGAEARITYKRGYPPTVNAEAQTEFAADCAAAVAGADAVDRNTPPIMPAEDFSYMLEARPGAYIFLGNGDTAMCHHPMYDFDDKIIPLGCSWFAELVERRMPAN